MKHGTGVMVATLMFVLAAGAHAQTAIYTPNPAGDSKGAPPSVLSLRIDTSGPKAIVKKNDGGAFQTSGTLTLYQNGSAIASAAHQAGTFSVTIPFAWNFTSGSRTYTSKSSSNPYLSGAVTVTATPVAPAASHKVGVVLFRHGRSIWEVRQDVDVIVAMIANGRTRRMGNGRIAELVIQLEVPWNETEPYAGRYDFFWYQDFARLCEEKGVKWTPLVSPHYLPEHIRQKYAGDRITNMQGGLLDPPFLKHSPSSAVWGTEAASWAKAFIRAMAYDAGRNHFGRNVAIDEVLVANEMMYPTSVLTSRDSASVKKWQQQFPGSSYPATLTTAFRAFRAEQLSYAINAMMSGVRAALSEVGASSTGVSSKLYPYYFPRANDSLNDRYAGYTDSSLSFLNANFSGIFAMDMYPKPQAANCGTWYYTNDYGAARQRTTRPLYVAEFNAPKEACKNWVLSRADVSKVAIAGFQSYNVRAFVFFAWNPNGTGAIYKITSEQALGLRDALNWLAP